MASAAKRRTFSHLRNLTPCGAMTNREITASWDRAMMAVMAKPGEVREAPRGAIGTGWDAAIKSGLAEVSPAGSPARRANTVHGARSVPWSDIRSF